MSVTSPDPCPLKGPEAAPLAITAYTVSAYAETKSVSAFFSTVRPGDSSNQKWGIGY